MSDTTHYNLEKAAAAVAAYISQGPPLSELPLAATRKAIDDAQAGAAMPDVDEAWVTVPADVGDVRALIIKPRGVKAPLPAVLYMHGGGWIFGSVHSHGRLARELAVAADSAVVFIDYALAPEARYPVQIEQCYAVARWVGEQGQDHGLDASRIAVAGDSAGGNMATVLCILAKQRGDVSFVQQSMYYPMTDALTSKDTESYRLFKDGPYGDRRHDGLVLGHVPRRGRTCAWTAPCRRYGRRSRTSGASRPRWSSSTKTIPSRSGRGVRRPATRRRCADGVRPCQRHDARLHDAERAPRQRVHEGRDGRGGSGVPQGLRRGSSKAAVMQRRPEPASPEGADRLAIRELFDAFAHCADRRDADGQKALFTADTRFVVYMGGDGTDPTYTIDGREALAPIFADLNRYEATTHFNGQSTIELDGDRATGESYTIAHHLFTEEGDRMIMVASLRYLDTFAKIEGAWYFAERKLIVDWSETRPSPRGT